ncbi:MAG: baseplate J/gp47 family protein [Synergistaceae bacterium]|nr:baseplate J/gp47 family protein [Synergistaceae bacterium]
MKSELFPALNDITFANKTPEEIESEIIKIYENLSGRSLARGDPVRLFLETIILVIIHQRALIDHSAKMNLLAYATGDYLDHLGALLGVMRLEASSALTTLKFTLSEAQEANILIPVGTRATPDGTIYFATTEAIEIPAGETEIKITAQCTVTGVQGNGYIKGQIKKLVDPFIYEMDVENITESSGGSDIESDENYRERIQLAPESFSVAGSKGAYKFYALSANANIIDVAVIAPEDADFCLPGNVYLFPLMSGGEIPSQEILDAVYAICNAETIRPDTDYLHVLEPGTVNYDVEVIYYIDRQRATQAAQIQNAVNIAVTNWISWQKSKLGRDINPSELIHMIIDAGAKRAVVNLPLFTVITQWSVAQENSISVTFGGFENG